MLKLLITSLIAFTAYATPNYFFAEFLPESNQAVEYGFPSEVKIVSVEVVRGDLFEAPSARVVYTADGVELKVEKRLTKTARAGSYINAKVNLSFKDVTAPGDENSDTRSLDLALRSSADGGWISDLEVSAVAVKRYEYGHTPAEYKEFKYEYQD